MHLACLHNMFVFISKDKNQTTEKNKTNENSTLNGYFYSAMQLANAYKNVQLKLKDIFFIRSLSKYKNIALCKDECQIIIRIFNFFMYVCWLWIFFHVFSNRDDELDWINISVCLYNKISVSYINCVVCGMDMGIFLCVLKINI